MSKALDGRVVIVTGASSGIGHATAREAAAQGANVVLAARRADRISELQTEINGSGGEAIAITTDVTDRDMVEHMVSQTMEAFGRIDDLVNNAGVMPLSPMKQRRVADWEWMLDVNVKGLLYCVAAVLPTMLAQERGHIVNVGSVAGRRPFPSGAVYSASKYAVRAISAGLRLELSAQHGIRVTDVEPGVVSTELLDHIPDSGTTERFHDTWLGKTPLRAEDIANTIVWVLSQPDRVNVNEVLVRPTDQET